MNIKNGENFNFNFATRAYLIVPLKTNNLILLKALFKFAVELILLGYSLLYDGIVWKASQTIPRVYFEHNNFLIANFLDKLEGRNTHASELLAFIQTMSFYCAFSRLTFVCGQFQT